MGGRHAGHATAEDEHFGGEVDGFIIDIPCPHSLYGEEEGKERGRESREMHWTGWGSSVELTLVERMGDIVSCLYNTIAY